MLLAAASPLHPGGASRIAHSSVVGQSWNQLVVVSHRRRPAMGTVTGMETSLFTCIPKNAGCT